MQPERSNKENRTGDTVFHGGFGLINYQEIVKPTFHAYRFMNELGDEVLQRETGGIVSRDKQTGRVTVVAYHYPPEMKVSLPVTNTLAAAAIDASGSARELTLDLDHLPAGASFEVEVLDRRRGGGLGSHGTARATDAGTDGRASQAGMEHEKGGGAGRQEWPAAFQLQHACLEPGVSEANVAAGWAGTNGR